MSTGSVVLLILIAVWSTLEYQRRERKHKALLALLAKGTSLCSGTIAPAAWKLLGEAVLAVLLAITCVMMLYGGGRQLASPGLLYGMGALFGAMMVLTLLMLARDVRKRSSLSQKPREQS